MPHHVPQMLEASIDHGQVWTTDVVKLPLGRGRLAAAALGPLPVRVLVDGKLRGMAPLELPLDAGDYTVTAEIDTDGASQTLTRKGVISHGKLERVEFETRGQVLVESDPAPVTVCDRAGKVLADSTPVTLTLPAGPRRLVLRSPPARQDTAVKVTVPAGGQVAVKGTLPWSPGRLELASTPSKATVREAGRALGRTGLTVTVPGPGRRTFDLELDGYRPARVSVDSRPGETVRTAVVLEPIPPQPPPLPAVATEEAVPVVTARAPTGGTEHLASLPVPPGCVELERNDPGYQECKNTLDGSVLVGIPGGRFQMGSEDGDADERPVHWVTLSGYWMGKYEVTWKQYLAFCRATSRTPPTKPEWARDDHPVVNVSHHDAVAYCRWAMLRLPTEAEWEYAARGQEGRKYPWGNQPPEKVGVLVGNFADETAKRTYSYFRIIEGYDDKAVQTASVGSFPNGVSPFGLLDMAGNVWEWCQDWYDSDYYQQTPEKDPKGPDSTEGLRVLRVGSWRGNSDWVRSANRHWAAPGYRNGNGGFRVARSSP